MGLLTADKSSRINFLLSFVHKYGNRVSVILYLSGILTFAVFISEQWSEKTYFSDNALLPGLVNREFTLTSQFDSLPNVLLDETRKAAGKIPYERIEYEFQRIGLEVYYQNFTLNYPLHTKPSLHGRNVYAIFRAPRAPSTEALVLSTPFRPDGHPHGSTRPSVSLMLSLAKYFASKNYWAKDIIFLISDQDLVGTQAWLNAYHDVRTSSVLTSSPLPASSGPIQAAINLELHTTQMSSIDIKIEGLNGQLPNLDLFNVAVELCTRESVTPTFQQASHPFAGPEFEVWKQYAVTALSMMRSQAISSPTGAHGLFQKFAIQSISLKSVARKSSGSEKPYASVNLLQVGRVVEGIFRSLNNLLERFNRSYWFYLLPSTRRYLSIGYYMIPFALITSPLILTALLGYIRLSYGEQKDQESSPAGHEDHKKTKESAGVTGDPAPLEDGIPFWFFAHLMGLVLVSIPFLMERHVSAVVASDHWSTENLVFSSIVSFSLLLILTPVTRRGTACKLAQKVIGLLNAALLFSCISLINISLALALSLVYSPVLSIVGQPGSQLSRARSLTYKLLIILIHPISMNYSCHLAMSMYLHSEASVAEHVSGALHSQKAALLSCIEDWYIYGHWIYLLSSAFLFPVWLQAWCST